MCMSVTRSLYIGIFLYCYILICSSLFNVYRFFQNSYLLECEISGCRCILPHDVMWTSNVLSWEQLELIGVF